MLHGFRDEWRCHFANITRKTFPVFFIVVEAVGPKTRGTCFEGDSKLFLNEPRNIPELVRNDSGMLPEYPRMIPT